MAQARAPFVQHLESAKAMLVEARLIPFQFFGSKTLKGEGLQPFDEFGKAESTLTASLAASITLVVTSLLAQNLPVSDTPDSGAIYSYSKGMTAAIEKLSTATVPLIRARVAAANARAIAAAASGLPSATPGADVPRADEGEEEMPDAS